jgi:hypothetical protein
MTGKRPQIDKPRVLFWVLAFLGFAVLGYVYRWWSGDARNASIFATPNFDVFIVPRVTRTGLEMMLISLLVLSILGALKLVSQSRVQLQTVIRMYGLYLLMAINPPVLATVAWFSNGFDLEHGWIVVVFFVLMVIILELIVIAFLFRSVFKFTSSLLIACLALPAAFWGLWTGFFFESFRPAITESCWADLNLQLPSSELTLRTYKRWASRRDSIPLATSLPPVDYITKLTATSPNELEDACQDKRAFSFQAAHYVLWFDLEFYAKDGFAYKAQTLVTFSEDLELKLLDTWKFQKDRLAKPNGLVGNKRERIGELGIIGQQLEPLFQVVPDLRQSPCVGFTRPKSATDDSRIVADFDTSSTLKNLYIIRSGKLERAWNQEQIRASLQRISQRLGYETIQTWNEQRVFDGGIASCSANKAYYGLQRLEERYVAYIPMIEVATGMKKFNVVLSFLTSSKPSLNISKLHPTKPQFEQRIYEFLPTEQDIPWNNVSTDDLEYSGSRLISQKTMK